MNKTVKTLSLTILSIFTLVSNINAFEKKYLDECPQNIIRKISFKSHPWKNEITSKLYNDLVLTKKTSIDIPDGALQGFTLTDKYVIFAQWFNDFLSNNIYILDNKTFNTKAIISKYSFGHANDFTYNSKTKKILVTNNYDKSVNKLSNFDIKDKLIFDDKFGINMIDKNIKHFNYSTNPFITNQLNNIIEINPSAIAYDHDHDQYIILDNSDKKIYTTDNNFNIIRSFSIINNSTGLDTTLMTSQGLGYWNNHIYYTTFEVGRPSLYQSIYNYDETSSNLVYIFDLYGNLDRILYIPTSKLSLNLDENYIKTAVELESISFYNNGTMLLGFNIYPEYYSYKNNPTCMGGVSKTQIAFYTSDSLKRDYLNIKNIKLNHLPKKLEYVKDLGFLDLSGGILELTYTDDVKEEINLDNDKISIEGFDNSKVGTNTIKVKYGDLTTSFNIEIIEN